MGALLHIFFVVTVYFSVAEAYSSGPPTSVCTSLQPGHNQRFQSGNGGYIVSIPSSLPRATSGAGFSYTSGASYVVRIEKNDASVTNFRGFVIQAVQADTNNLLGTFASPAATQRYLSCPGNGMASICHSSNPSRTVEEFTWTAPTGSGGTVDFRYTVVRTYQTYYYALIASGVNNHVVRTMPTDPPTQPPKTNPPTNPPTDPPTNPPTTNPPTNLPTNPPTNPPTDPPTNPPNNPTTNLPTNPPTNPPTNVATKPPTKPPTNTDSPTEPPTNPPTNVPMQTMGMITSNVRPTEPATAVPITTEASNTAEMIDGNNSATGLFSYWSLLIVIISTIISTLSF